MIFIGGMDGPYRIGPPGRCVPSSWPSDASQEQQLRDSVSRRLQRFKHDSVLTTRSLARVAVATSPSLVCFLVA